jgi:hypothetical protein
MITAHQLHTRLDDRQHEAAWLQGEVSRLLDLLAANADAQDKLKANLRLDGLYNRLHPLSKRSPEGVELIAQISETEADIRNTTHTPLTTL